MIKILLTSILAGMIVFIWTSFSWMQLSWHHQTLNGFKNEKQVSEVLLKNTVNSGIYLLPNSGKPSDELSYEEKQAQQEDVMKRMKTGPFAFISIQPHGISHDMTSSMIRSFSLNVIIALLISLLLSCTRDLSYGGRVFFVTIIGLIIGLQGHLPNWFWWEFSAHYTLVQIADLIIGWFLAGLVIAIYSGKGSYTHNQ